MNAPPLQFISRQTPTATSIAYAWWQSMHTRVDLVVHGQEEALRPLAESIRTEMDRLEKIGNYFNRASELHALNQAATGECIDTSPELYDMIADCMRHHTLTNGYFDISFRSEQGAESAIHAIELLPDRPCIRLNRANMRLDLSGYLKGYALDRVKQIIAHAQPPVHVLLNFGNSSVLAHGNHPNGEGWKVKFGDDYAERVPEVQLFDRFLTTSGNESTARRHIVNPGTGTYVEGCRQVSVVTRGGAEGEVLATALFAAPPGEHAAILAHYADAEEIIY